MSLEGRLTGVSLEGRLTGIERDFLVACLIYQTVNNITCGKTGNQSIEATFERRERARANCTHEPEALHVSRTHTVMITYLPP